LAIAISIRACLAGQRVAFATATEWVARLAEAQRAGKLAEEIARLQRIPLLVVDEVGYIPFDPAAANLIFQLVSARWDTRRDALVRPRGSAPCPQKLTSRLEVLPPDEDLVRSADGQAVRRPGSKVRHATPAPDPRGAEQTARHRRLQLGPCYSGDNKLVSSHPLDVVLDAHLPPQFRRPPAGDPARAARLIHNGSGAVCRHRLNPLFNR
jgi:hypothetical protein